MRSVNAYFSVSHHTWARRTQLSCGWDHSCKVSFVSICKTPLTVRATEPVHSWMYSTNHNLFYICPSLVKMTICAILWSGNILMYNHSSLTHCWYLHESMYACVCVCVCVTTHVYILIFPHMFSSTLHFLKWCNIKIIFKKLPEGYLTFF